MESVLTGSLRNVLVLCGTLLGLTDTRAVTFQVSDHTTDPGASITVPVTVSGFSGVTSFQFTLAWDPGVLAFANHGDYGLAFLRSGSFGTTRVADGKLTVAWDDEESEGKALGDGATLFTVTFNAIGGNGSSSSISFTDDPTQREVSVDFSVTGFNSVAGTVQVGTVPTGDPPTIISQPAAQTVMAGDDVSFVVVANGSEPLGFEWRRNGVVFGGATSSQLSLSNVQAENSGDYTVVVSNEFGSEVSTAATLTVNPAVVVQPPVIQTQPLSQVVTEGAALRLFALAEGTAPLGFQWLKDGLSVNGATGAAFNVNNVRASDAGTYTVVVWNSAGTVTSLPATVTVTPAVTIQAPVVSVQPVSQTGAVGGTITFSVSATGTVPLAYQWSKDGTEMLRANDPILILSALRFDDAGDYTVRVSNPAGGVTSDAAVLTVKEASSDDAPVITVQPVGQTVNAGDTVQFTVLATGLGPLQFQWHKDGEAIEGARGGLHIVRNARLSDSGVYTVTVGNSQGSATSMPVELTVNPSEGKELPEITAQPASVGTVVGETAAFTVLAQGQGPFQYQWQRNGMALDGENSALLRLSEVEPDDAGIYTVLVSNEQGTVTSAGATLTVSMGSAGGQGVPVFTAHPSDQVAAEGDRVTFEVEVDGAAPFAFQWKKDGVDLVGANDSVLILDDASLDDAGAYNAAVLNQFGSASSVVATLRVLKPPAILVQPEDQAVGVGMSVELRVTATGTEPLQYQWHKNGAVLPEANGSRLFFEQVSEEDAGTFSVELSNESGRVFSSAAELIVLSPRGVARNDLNGDGSADIVFQDAEGFLAAWMMNGVDLAEARFLSPNNVGDKNWKLAGRGDLDGDGQADLVFQHTNGRLAVWMMNGSELAGAALLSPSSFGAAGWSLAAVGEFNSDRKADLVFQHSDGAISIWHMDGARRISSTLARPTAPDDPQWRVVAAGDFDGDGEDDIVFQHADGLVAIWLMNGNRLREAVIPNQGGVGDSQWRVVGSGDFDEDGGEDLLFQHDGGGTVAVWLMNAALLETARLLNPANPGGTWRIGLRGNAG